MRAHHQQTIQRLVTHFQNDPRFPALIVGGSVAKGWAGDDSDVDIMLVATDEVYAQHLATGEVTYFDQELATYPGGYVDGKIIDVAYLREVADHGNEPSRAAFLGAMIGYSRIPDLDLGALIARIVAYPEQERAARIRAFASHMTIMNWYMGEAEKRHDPYLLSWTANNLALYGGRLILAHNRLLYPYHKWFLHQLRMAPDKPADLLPLLEAALKQPGRETASAFYDCVMSFQDWGVTLHQAGADFVRETEWSWREGRHPLADW